MSANTIGGISNSEPSKTDSAPFARRTVKYVRDQSGLMDVTTPILDPKSVAVSDKIPTRSPISKRDVESPPAAPSGEGCMTLGILSDVDNTIRSSLRDTE